VRGSYRRKRSELEPPPEHSLLFRDPTPADVIRRITRQNSLDPRLLPADRHMQRWAVGQGTGLPNASRALFLKSSMSPLPEHESIVTDQVVLSSPTYWRRFVVLWYRSDCSTDQLATELAMSRDKVFIERRLVLAYLLGRLSAVGIRLAMWEPES
jgi:hypothetical protein